MLGKSREKEKWRERTRQTWNMWLEEGDRENERFQR